MINAANTISMRNIRVKYQNVSQAVCAYTYYFRKRPGRALVGA